ncbi:hypothetical protein H4219_002678 [Mycoemilia scoparia]|uniref:Sepiapterin reductase n=1 Tax=Mycoemilia scoparia TaxID=417184 RepID=A0A9W7ZWV6_9FUNG|nr:hypothetical protein H4219_002678 [Mycoemilia scoparia]
MVNARHYIVVVTGAGRGLGREIVKQISSTFVSSSPNTRVEVVLVGRTKKSLEEVASEVQGERVRGWVCDDVDLGASDLTRPIQRVENTLKEVQATIAGSEQKVSMVLVQNAGTLGDLSMKVEDYDYRLVDDYFRLNLTSFTLLCSMFIKLCKSAKCNETTIVNISSLLAIEAHPYWGLYATGKAARDHLMKVIAKEEGPAVQTLSYAPGPLDNDMQAQVRNTLGDPEQKRIFTLMAESRTLVQLNDTAKKLANILLNSKFNSGSHVDFYDDLAQNAP